LGYGKFRKHQVATSKRLIHPAHSATAAASAELRNSDLAAD